MLKTVVLSSSGYRFLLMCSLLYLPLTSYRLSLVRAAFLDYGGGVRNASMGDSTVAYGEETFSAQVNPSLLTQVRSPQIGFEYQKLFTGLSGTQGNVTGFRSVDIGVSNVSLAYPFRRVIGHFGVSYIRFSSQNQYEEETIILTGARNLNDLILRNEEETIGLGMGLKFLRRSVESDPFTNAVFKQSGNSASAVTLDLGSFFRPVSILSLGLALQNILTADVGIIREDYVRRQIIAGLSWQDPIKEFAGRTVISLAVSKREGEPRTNFHIGLEASFSNFLPRLGFNRDEFTSGFGVEFRKNERWGLALDYAFIFPLTVAGTSGSHRVALKVDWDKPDKI